MGKNEQDLSQKQEDNLLGTIFLGVLAALFIIIGACMLFVQNIQLVYVLYALASIIIVLGIGMIVRYYVSQAYRNAHDYSFSCGVVCVILGGCGLVRAKELVGGVPTLIGILVLAFAIIMMQQALQMHILKQTSWIAVLILSLATLLASILLLCNLTAITGKISKFEYWVLLIAGVLALVSQLISEIGVRLFAKEEKKKKEKQAEHTETDEQKSDEKEEGEES